MNAAKKSLSDDSAVARKDMAESARKASKAISDSAAESSRQSKSFTELAAKAKIDLSNQSGKLKQEVDGTRQQLADAGKLQPQMNAMQNQLKDAIDRIRDQQKTISSSEEFVKQVFSSHTTDSFVVGQQPTNRVVTRPPAAGGNRAIVVFLLSNTPISQTLQLQYRVFAQPAGSFFNIHNMVVFFWGEPLGNLNNQQLSASYFPDKTDTTIIHSLTEDKGRIYADGVPLPYLNEPDADFKDNQFFKRVGDGFVTIP